MRTQRPFRFRHEGSWKTGHYDPDRRILIALKGDLVTTVITGVDPGYVERLKEKGAR